MMGTSNFSDQFKRDSMVSEMEFNRLSRSNYSK